MRSWLLCLIPTSFDKKDKKYGDRFLASLFDTPSFDLFEVADVEYSDVLSDAVWGKYNWHRFLEESGSVEFIPLKDYDLATGQSDERFWIAIDDV